MRLHQERRSEAYFAPGQDKVTEATLLAVEYGSSATQLLHGHGYGPGHSVSVRAVAERVWEKCPACDYVGAHASVTNHRKKIHTATEPISTQRADLEKTVRAMGGSWDTERGLRALRDAGHAPQDKHTHATLRALASEGVLEKVEDWPVRYRLADASRAGARP